MEFHLISNGAVAFVFVATFFALVGIDRCMKVSVDYIAQVFEDIRTNKLQRIKDDAWAEAFAERIRVAEAQQVEQALFSIRRGL